MKINAIYEDTQENFLFYAKGKGWQEKVMEEQEVTDEEGNTTTEMVEVDNPYTLSDFVTDTANQVLTKELADVMKREIKSQGIASINAQQAQVEEEIKARLSVTVE